MKKETVKLSCNVTSELMERIEEYADRMNITKTSAVAVLVSQALDAQRTMSNITELLKLAKEQQE